MEISRSPLVKETATAGKVTNLLRFKQEEVEEKIDPYEAMMTRLEADEKSGNDFKVKLRVNANPQVEAFVEIDKASGNVLSGRGSGLIELEAGTDLFNINGDYTLNSGNYKFVAMGLVARSASSSLVHTAKVPRSFWILGLLILCALT